MCNITKYYIYLLSITYYYCLIKIVMVFFHHLILNNLKQYSQDCFWLTHRDKDIPVFIFYFELITLLMYYLLYFIIWDPNYTNVVKVLYAVKHRYQKLLDLICSFYYFHDSNNQFILYLFPLNLSFLINLYSILHYQNMHIT